MGSHTVTELVFHKFKSAKALEAFMEGLDKAGVEFAECQIHEANARGEVRAGFKYRDATGEESGELIVSDYIVDP
jgi:hypothetical protein